MLKAQRPASRQFTLLTAAVAGFAVLAAIVWLARGRDPGLLVASLMDVLRDVGPLEFFVAMAVLPALGLPLSLFCLTAGSAFAPQLGMPGVIGFAALAITANMGLSYMLARRVLHPPLQFLLQRLGYRLPQVSSGDTTDLIILLRVTPGIPFPVQNYLLGIAGVPFFRYLGVSCLFALPLNAAIIIFGKALLQGQARMALFGLLLILAVLSAIQLVRRRLGRRHVAGG